MPFARNHITIQRVRRTFHTPALFLHSITYIRQKRLQLIPRHAPPLPRIRGQRNVGHRHLLRQIAALFQREPPITIFLGHLITQDLHMPLVRKSLPRGLHSINLVIGINNQVLEPRVNNINSSLKSSCHHYKIITIRHNVQLLDTLNYVALLFCEWLVLVLRGVNLNRMKALIFRCLHNVLIMRNERRITPVPYTWERVEVLNMIYNIPKIYICARAKAGLYLTFIALMR